MRGGFVPKPQALYLFAGLPRKSDVASYLQKAGWEVTQVDILRSPSHDVSDPAVAESLVSKVAASVFKAVIISPPCDTFTRVMFANDNGPKPLRTSLHARGFEWLGGNSARKVKLGNFLADLTFKVFAAQLRTEPGWAVVEFPEDLG